MTVAPELGETPTQPSRRARLADMAGALRFARVLGAHDRMAPDRLAAWQAERLAELQAFARARSPFYRDRDPRLTLDKATLMERYDEILTEPDLSLAAIEAHVESLRGDELLHGRYRVMSTGGTSGARAVVPYARREWWAAMSSFLRWSAMTGRAPGRDTRIASVMGPGPRHMSWRYNATLDIGATQMLRLHATAPLSELVDALQDFQPEELSGFPSVIGLLAREQLAGRLEIAPRYVATASEVRTPDMERAMVEAWGLHPHENYAVTEAGFVACSCTAQEGLHVLEDHTMVEILDDDGRPVADGEPGRVVLTPLHGRTLPLLRYEMGDLARATRAPCGCGRPYLRLLELQGRRDDVLDLPAADGGTVQVHYLALQGPLSTVPGLSQCQVVVPASGPLCLRMTVMEGTEPARCATAARTALATALEQTGALADGLAVEVADDLPRSPVGKQRFVVRA